MAGRDSVLAALDSPVELLLLLFVALLVFGPKRLTEIGRSLGPALKEFRDSVSGETGRRGIASATAPAPAAEVEQDAPPSA